MKLAIVTPDLIGPIKNGGIGTYASNLAFLWAQGGNAVTVIFTGMSEVGNEWKEAYSAEGIAVRQLTWSLERRFTDSLVQDWYYARAEEVRDLLNEDTFDAVNFQDWQANGLVTLQARRAGQAFASTVCTLTVHSPSRWGTAGQQRWPRNPMIDSRVDAAESWCIEAADHVYFPSQHMQSWVEAQGWQPRTSTLMHYPLLASPGREDEPTRPALPGPAAASAAEVRLAFFGRLETRKGLELFCDALTLLSPHDKSLLGSVWFLGKPGQTSTSLLGDAYVRSAMEAAGIPYAIFSNLDSEEALQKLQQDGVVAVMPSLLDNLPFAALECISRKIPLIASNAGGLRELLPASSLFALDSSELSHLISSLLRGRQLEAATFDQEAANEIWARSPSVLAVGNGRVCPSSITSSTENIKTQGRLISRQVSWTESDDKHTAVLVGDADVAMDDGQLEHLVNGFANGEPEAGNLLVVGRERQGPSDVWPVVGSILQQLSRESADAVALVDESLFNAVWPTISSDDCIASLVVACHAAGARQICVPANVATLPVPHEHSYDTRVRDIGRIEDLLPSQLKGLVGRLAYPLVLDARVKRLPDGSVWYVIDEMLTRAMPLASRRRHSALVLAGHLKRLVGTGSYG